MIFDKDKILAGVQFISNKLDLFEYGDSGKLNDAERLVILKTTASAIENSLAVEGFLAMYKTSLDKLSGK